MWLKLMESDRVESVTDVALDWEAIGRDVRRRCREAAAQGTARLLKLPPSAPTTPTKDFPRDVS